MKIAMKIARVPRFLSGIALPLFHKPYLTSSCTCVHVFTELAKD